MQKIPTQNRNRMQSLRLTRLKPFAGNFYKYAGKPCYSAQNYICATKSDFHGSVGLTATHLPPWPGALWAAWGQDFSGGVHFCTPNQTVQDSSHYKHHTTSLKVAGIESSRAYVRIPRNLLHGGLRLYQQLTPGQFITRFEKPSMRWYIHTYIFTSLLCEIYCILQNSVYNI